MGVKITLASTIHKQATEIILLQIISEQILTVLQTKSFVLV